MLTFGLLSPGKGIEAMIDALPAIVAAHPDVLYCIAGATHPNLVAHEGEAYRERLQALAAVWAWPTMSAGSTPSWTPTNCSTCSRPPTSIVTPYIGAQQSTSGTLSYAMALGKAVVSTPYVHAIELLADDHGVLVPFHDSEALGAAIVDLLGDPERLHDIAAAGLWPRPRHDLAALCRAEPSTWSRTVVSKPLSPPCRRQSASRDCCASATSTGILQHSIHGIPDRRHGYCVDDNARALMLMHRLDGQALRQCGQLTTVFASFVQHAWNPDTGRIPQFHGLRAELAWRMSGRRTAAGARSGRSASPRAMHRCAVCGAGRANCSTDTAPFGAWASSRRARSPLRCWAPRAWPRRSRDHALAPTGSSRQGQTG